MTEQVGLSAELVFEGCLEAFRGRVEGGVLYELAYAYRVALLFCLGG